MENEKAIALIEQDRDAVLSQCVSIEVNSPRTEELASGLLISVREAKKKILAFIKTWTDPLEEQKKRWFSVRDNLMRPLIPAEANLCEQLIEYRKVQLAEVAERKKVLYDEGTDNPLPEVVIPYVAEPEKTVRTEKGKVTLVESWKAVVVDMKLVPTYWQGQRILDPIMSVLNDLAGPNIEPPPGIIFERTLTPRVGK